uniref:Uncharacterized protein n=1 Tax=Picea sitchensis TaxID=3332 RepID=A0A6B9XUM4_PICSI|nr:hypothetical protein Q903MT_gene6632 [Picea sitchensis]
MHRMIYISYSVRYADDHLSWGIHLILMGHVIGAFTPFNSGAMGVESHSSTNQ